MRLAKRLAFFRSDFFFGIIKGEQPLFATATTAACGGYREELLGQRPAGCECRPRHEADAGCRNPSGPARRNRRDLAALNTQHLLRKPVCGLKAPLGLSCPAGTAVLSGSLLPPKENISVSAALSHKPIYLISISTFPDTCASTPSDAVAFKKPGNCFSSSASALPRWLMASFSSGVSWA